MASDKPLSQTANRIVAAIATGLVGLFGALASPNADARGEGGNAHVGTVRAPVAGGRVMGGRNFGNFRGGYNGNFRGSYSGRYYGGRRGFPVIVRGGGWWGGPVGYVDAGYASGFIVPTAPIFFIAPPRIITRYIYVLPPRQTLPAHRYCYTWKDTTVCKNPNGTTDRFTNKVATTSPVSPPPPPAKPLENVKPPHTATAAPPACYRTVVQVHAFNSTSSLDKQFPKSIPDNCSAVITRINTYNDQPATDIQRKNGVVTINYNGSTVDTKSDTLIQSHAHTVYNIATLTPSSTWDKTFPPLDGKRKPLTHTTIVHGNTSADTIGIDPKRGDDGVFITDKPAVPVSAPAAAAAAPPQPTVTTPQPPPAAATGTAASSGTATAQVSSTPQNFAASSVATKNAVAQEQHKKEQAPPSKGHWYTSWWTWGTAAAIGATALIVKAINNARYAAGPDGGPEGGPHGGGDGAGGEAPGVGGGEGEAGAARGGGEPGGDPRGARAAGQVFDGAELNTIFKAFRENREPGNDVKFKLDEGRDAKVLVGAKDADVEVRRDGIKAKAKDSAVTFSDETIKGMLAAYANLKSDNGKHRVAVKCNDETFNRVVEIASQIKGQQFEFVRKPSAPSPAAPTATAAAPARPANSSMFNNRRAANADNYQLAA
jgi:hypothetical protein